MGKTLFLNQLLSYLESDDRNKWPKDQVIQEIYGLSKNSRTVRQSSSEVLVTMWSEPFILEKNGQRTTVFLMDTINVFKYESTLDFNVDFNLVADIVGLFLTTSSTVIYLKKQNFLVNYL